MEEKVIVESRVYDAVFPMSLVLFIIAGVGGVFSLIWMFCIFQIGMFGFAFCCVLVACGIATNNHYKQTKLYVTDKRVYGKTSKGKQVDIPLGQISAVGTTANGNVSISSSSGRIDFLRLENSEEIRQAISDLIARNSYSSSAPTEYIKESSADEIVKYKTLLDQGVISQEEFDLKKKQLLGI